MKKISCLLAAIPFALTMANLPAANAAPITPPRQVQAVLVDPSPAVVPEVVLQTVNLPDEDQSYASGITACFAGTIGNKLLVAGGCSMTENKISFSSDRQFFNEVYTARLTNQNKLQWKKAGTLPKALANGASFTVDDSIIIAGGIGSDTISSKKVYKLTLDTNGLLETAELPDLPAGMNNMGSCVIDRKLYLVGGAFKGQQSNAVLSLDLDKTELGWQTVTYYPGSARIDPACAAIDGELFIWGGYSVDNPPIMSTDGYKFNPAANSWSSAATPKLVDGFRSSRIYTGGASAVAVGNHRIVVTGGVNPEIFKKEALKMDGDYLKHTPDWYKYNRFIMVYRSDTNSWEIPAQTAQTAKNGAINIFFGNKVYNIGGEIAPGICNNKIATININ